MRRAGHEVTSLRRGRGAGVLGRAAAATLAGALCLTGAGECRAQSAGLNTAKGITAGGMLGAEVVLVAEAAIGVKPKWAYLVGGLAGAGAGAVGGYYLTDGSDTELSSFMLAGGIALVIPTMIAVVAATSFDPPDNYRVDVPYDGEPVLEDEPVPGGADDSLSMRLWLPNVGVTRAFSAEEQAKFRVEQVVELHVGLLRGAF